MLKLKKLSQDGFAPMVVSIVIVVVLSLLTLGFVALANNNKQNALSVQLNNDAYYGAESGINDAIEAIEHGFNQQKSVCGQTSATATNPYLDNDQIGAGNDYYSCLLINFSPASLQYSSVSQGQPVVAVLSTVNSAGSPQDPTDLVFSWQPSSDVEPSPYKFAPSNYLSCSGAGTNGPCLPSTAAWAGLNSDPTTGVLRLSLTPLPESGPLPTDTSSTFTAYLYPAANSTPGTLTYAAFDQGQNAGGVLSGNCNNNQATQPLNLPDSCNVDIQIPAGVIAGGTNGFLMTLSSIYTSSQVSIQAYGSGRTPLNFQNAQTLIDSTGDASGVLKRLQVRISDINDSGMPAYGIASTNTICSDLKSRPANQTTGQPAGTTSDCTL